MSPMEPHKSDSIAPLDESLQLMPSDDEEQLHWMMRSIYKVPARITALNSEAYQPQLVSFGPYHHGEHQLRPMEEHKRRAVRHFLKRSGKLHKHLLESLKEVAWVLEESYDELDPKWKAGSGEGTAFLELMITDGCFILEIMRFTAEAVVDYASNDPIFSEHGKHFIIPDIWGDMLMLENQLPMLVLDRLVAIESGKKGEEFNPSPIYKLWFSSKGITRMDKCLHILDVFRHSMLMEREKKDKEGDQLINRLILKFCSPSKCITRMGKYLHVPDVFRKSMLMDPEKKDEEMEFRMENIQLATATELSEHGIKFKRSETDSLNDISFEGGVLTLPGIWVDVQTMSTFLNLMAFERLHFGATNRVMSYTYCMDHLINNERDVQLLRTQGIIVNFLESDEALAKMFGSLGKVVMIDPGRSLREVLKNVNKYCNKRWNMWRANLIHTYFRNPWAALSLIAAVFLFALTIIQTVYSVLGSPK